MGVNGEAEWEVKQRMEMVEAAVAREQGLFVASCFVHGVLLMISIFHLGLASRGTRVAYDRYKHIVLCLRTAFALWLALIPLVELFYQLRWHLSPENHYLLFYTEKTLQILAWSANTAGTLWIARNSTFLQFHFLDHLLQVLSWVFVFVIEALRTAEYVDGSMHSLTEQYTSVVIVFFGGLYGITLLAFLLIDIIRKHNHGLPIGQRSYGFDETTGIRHSVLTTTTYETAD